jgi:rhamnulokinase
MATHYLACDLGAESGRLVLGTLRGGKLLLEEIHRFPNTPIKADGSLHWDVAQLFQELKIGLKKVAQLKIPIASISCDSWGVDYMLFDALGTVIPPTFHYRDRRAAKGVENANAKLQWPTIFAETGIQGLPFNTLFQLAAEVGDGFNYLLSGVDKAEVSLASTSQLYNPRARVWSKKLINALNLPQKLFPAIVPSGTKLGLLQREIAKETGLAGLQVVASCSHDTGAAVAGVPAVGQHWAYISSGTWSLMGVELPAPIVTDACRELNFTNEIGYGGTVRLLKNIIGLWVVQECRRAWAKAGQEFDYTRLTELAAAAPPFVSLINPTDARFVSPDDMPEKIAAFCRETDQPVPDNPGATIRCVLESLALLYRRTLKQIEQLTGTRIERVHIVGGGSKNALLNQFTADALQIPVVAGPVEATAAGNILIQAITLEQLPSLAAARDVVRQSMELGLVNPQSSEEWLKAYERFEAWF